MKSINGKFFVAIVGGFGLGNAAVYLLAGISGSAIVASAIGVLMVYLAFAMRGRDTEATIKAIKAREDKRQQEIAEAAK